MRVRSGLEKLLIHATDQTTLQILMIIVLEIMVWDREGSFG